MLFRLPLALPLLLSTLLVMTPAVTQADSCSRHFMVFVRVLPQCRMAIPSVDSPGNARIDISCTRDTGYSVSLMRDATERNEAHIINNVGNGTHQIIFLTIPAGSLQDGGILSPAPLFLTISY